MVGGQIIFPREGRWSVSRSQHQTKPNPSSVSKILDCIHWTWWQLLWISGSLITIIKGVNVSDHLSPVISEQLPPVLFNWNSIAAVTWETAGDLQIYFQNHFGSWTLHKLKFYILQVEHVAVTLLPLLFLLLLPGQVLEKCPARKAAEQAKGRQSGA